jgi:hypothetical protein
VVIAATINSRMTTMCQGSTGAPQLAVAVIFS